MNPPEKTTNFVPFAPPLIGNEEIEEVVATLKSGWITTGPKVKAFEKRFAEWVGAPYAAATFSCTSAMHLSLVALGIGPGDEVITTPFTFASTAHVILWCGAKPVFVDIRPDTLQIDERQIESKINPNTKVILPVHYGGNPAAIEEIVALAKRRGLAVIEDAAHAIGARVKDRSIGTVGDATCFSFYATKNITTAEGGMVTTRDAGLAEKVRKLSMYGISDSREIWKRYAPRGTWFYDVEMIGYKCNMTDIAAAMGLHQLNHLSEWIMLRTKYAGIYGERLKGLGCDFMRIAEDHQCAWHLFPLLLPEAVDRDRFIEYLTRSGVGSSVLFRPLHLHSAYQKVLGTREGDFPQSEKVYQRLVCLPLSPAVTEEEIYYVADTVRRGLEEGLWK
jgi:dTDP-4-amino-4,6-dideoxygalactose transaminase